MGVPSNIMVPFVGIEFDASLAAAGPADVPIQALLIGQMLSTGTGAAETKYVVGNADEVAALGGLGSQIHKMAQKFFANSSTVPCQIIMLADAGSATAATQANAITGTATASGELPFYYDGVRMVVSVAVGDTATVVGDALVAKIAEYEDRPFTAANVTGTVTRTQKNKGVSAGDMDVRICANAGETVPAGLAVSVGAVSAGTVDPDVQDAIDVIGDDWFQLVAHPYSDATNLGAIQTYAATQDGPMVMMDQVWFAPKRDTRSNLISMGLTTATYNSKHVCTPAWYKRLQAAHEGAAAMVGAIAQSLLADPGRPLHRVSLSGITSLNRNDVWTTTERNQCAVSGISTFTDGTGVQTEAVVTMYLKNPSGVSDTAYQLVGTVYNLMVQRYRFRVQILSKYPRARLVTNGEKLKPGLSYISEKTGRDEALVWARGLERDGLLEDYDTFKTVVVCQRSDSNPNRLEWLLPSNLVNAFMVGSADIQFRL